MTPTRHVGIYLFPDVEALDFAGPYEVFTTASRVSQRLHPDLAAPFHVFSVAATAPGRGPVRARAGLRIAPDHALHEHPPIDVLVIPGGVVTAERDKPDVLRWVADCARSAECVASVCTGAFILAQAGIVTQGPITTHWEDQRDLAAAFPALQVVDGPRWVEQGQVITSAGISAGIDMSLYLVERLCGASLAQATARQMDYAWPHG
ncbi:MAG: DJ-1/PfpI family protein [Comamonas sp.]